MPRQPSLQPRSGGVFYFWRGALTFRGQGMAIMTKNLTGDQEVIAAHMAATTAAFQMLGSIDIHDSPSG